MSREDDAEEELEEEGDSEADCFLRPWRLMGVTLVIINPSLSLSLSLSFSEGLPGVSEASESVRREMIRGGDFGGLVSWWFH